MSLRMKKIIAGKVNLYKFKCFIGYCTDDDNFVLSCNICNQIKSNKHFESDEQCKEYLELTWKYKNIELY